MSAVFHYLGPSLAVLLFARVPAIGVVWLRNATAAVVLAGMRRPWRLLSCLSARQRGVLLALGMVLPPMNSLFYLAIERLPLTTVGAIEFLGVITMAAVGVRSVRNATALSLTVAGVAVLTEIRLNANVIGFVLAFGNCVCFTVYLVLGHRIANSFSQSARARRPFDGIDQLALASIVAAFVATPIGLQGAFPAFDHPLLLLAGVGVGLCSSVIPYVTDQLAMARLPRATFALMMGLLPAVATVMGALVLGQIPTASDLVGVGLVMAGIGIHQPGPLPRVTSRSDD